MQRHHFNGQVEIRVDGVGQSESDRRKIAAALFEAAVLMEEEPNK